ncbi:hypothetical protein B0H13DRAFT_2305733 [Mycena leptocephala]|nr:hypothetical protein B0H13DRAFT_2305733 [Mycena leptocephala]
MHHEKIHHRKNMMPKWECGRGRKSPSATSQNDTGQRMRGDGSDKHQAKQEKSDELRRARVIGGADVEPYVPQMTADTTQGDHVYGTSPSISFTSIGCAFGIGVGLSLAAPSLAEATGRAHGVRWSGDEVRAFVLFTVRFLRRGGRESAPVDSRAASREQGPRCASRAGRWEKRDVISELLSPSLPSLLFSVAGLPLGLTPLPKALSPHPLSLEPFRLAD